MKNNETLLHFTVQGVIEELETIIDSCNGFDQILFGLIPEQFGIILEIVVYQDKVANRDPYNNYRQEYYDEYQQIKRERPFLIRRVHGLIRIPR
jgi:hypothetical protein